MPEPEKSNSISMARKSDLLSSQDQNNALIWSGVKSKCNPARSPSLGPKDISKE